MAKANKFHISDTPLRIANTKMIGFQQVLMRMNCRPLLLATITQFMVRACPPQQGTCYSGSASLSSRYGGNIVSRRCAETGNRDWCAVSYYPHTDIANFGCANEFSLPFGSATCGDGVGSINQAGCSMANTPSGPCYFCCCRGGSCNHPAIFAREASQISVYSQRRMMFLNHSGRTMITTLLSTVLFVFLIKLI